MVQILLFDDRLLPLLRPSAQFDFVHALRRHFPDLWDLVLTQNIIFIYALVGLGLIEPLPFDFCSCGSLQLVDAENFVYNVRCCCVWRGRLVELVLGLIILLVIVVVYHMPSTDRLHVPLVQLLRHPLVSTVRIVRIRNCHVLNVFDVDSVHLLR